MSAYTRIMISAKTTAHPPRSSRARRPLVWAALLFVCLGLGACAGGPSVKHAPLTQQREVEALVQLAAYPNSETVTTLVAMQQLLATHREWEGYELFGRLA